MAVMMEAINSIEEKNAALEGRWSGSQPMLRLIHCLIDDEAIKSAFLHQADSMNCAELENHNSTERREPTCWEMMSDKWNDKEFNPKMFREEIELNYSSVAAAFPDKCKTKMSEMMGTLKRIIQNWEASGQGDGGNNACDEETPARLELGVLSEGRPEYALSSRASFFIYKELYLLYLWDVAEMYDLTTSCMQTLDPGVAAGDGGKNEPSVVEKGDDSSIGSMDSKGTKGSKEIADIAATLSKQFNQRSESMQKSEQQEKSETPSASIMPLKKELAVRLSLWRRRKGL